MQNINQKGKSTDNQPYDKMLIPSNNPRTNRPVIVAVIPTTK